jgi:hypothetical protein
MVLEKEDGACEFFPSTLLLFHKYLFGLYGVQIWCQDPYCTCYRVKHICKDNHIWFSFSDVRQFLLCHFVGKETEADGESFV